MPISKEEMVALREDEDRRELARIVARSATPPEERPSFEEAARQALKQIEGRRAGDREERAEDERLSVELRDEEEREPTRQDGSLAFLMDESFDDPPAAHFPMGKPAMEREDIDR